MFRSPLADPQLIGVSSGASVGAALVITLGGPLLLDSLANGLGPAPIALAAFVGALASTSMVYRLASIGGRPPMTHMLLAGIAMNAFAWALIGVIVGVACTGPIGFVGLAVPHIITHPQRGWPIVLPVAANRFETSRNA